MNIHFNSDTITKLIFIGFLLGIGQFSALVLMVALAKVFGGGS